MAKHHTTKFQQWLERFVHEKDITNVECANLFGVNDSLIGHYLRGNRAPTYRTLSQIKKATGVDMNDLFD